jgi:hypothetical protein
MEGRRPATGAVEVDAPVSEEPVEPAARPRAVRRRAAAGPRVALAGRARGAGRTGRRLRALGRRIAVGGVQLTGVGLAREMRLTHRLSWSAEVTYDRGRVDASLGHVSIQGAAGGARLDLTGDLGPVALAAGAGLRLGVANMAGVPRAMASVQKRSLTALFGGPFASLGGSLRLPGGARLGASAEAGYVALGMRARIETAAAGELDLTGWWLAGTLSADVGW